MRRLRFFLIGLAVLATSCSRNEMVSDADCTFGEVTVSLVTDAEIGTAATKADGVETVPEELVPALEDFEVEIYNSEKIRLYRDTYENAADAKIRLNTGEYRLLAQHGDTLGCGFNKPYFMADQSFTLTAETPVQSIASVARLANVQMAVSFDETVPGSYYDYYVIVRHQEHAKKSIKFTKDETRLGYIPAGKSVVEFYADIDGNGSWKYSKSQVFTYEPNSFVKINVKIRDPREGNLVFNISVDGKETVYEDPTPIEAWAAPQEAPNVVLSGFDADNTFRMVEGVNIGAGATVSILAKAAVKNCWLTVTSEHLTAKGLPKEPVDLANADAETVAAFETNGIYWNEDLLGSRTLSYISFAELLADLSEEYRSAKTAKNIATFDLKVIDEVGKETSVSFSILSVPVSLTLSVEDYNVWATRIRAPKATASDGANPDLVRLQFRKQGGSWVTLDNAFSGSVLEMTAEDITGLEPGTKYQMRTIYNENTNLVSDQINVTTEEALQIGNSGFEEFTTEDFKYTVETGFLGTTEGKRQWYLPYSTKDNSWWAVNSRRTMPEATDENDLDYKVCPTCSYSTNAYEGGKAAQIATVQVARDATPSSDGSTNVYKAVGELFIGTANDLGEHSVDCHAFASRPTALKFMYRYDSFDGKDTFYARIEIRDENMNIIAESQVTDRGEVDRWTECTMELNYIDVQAVPAYIYVSFKSSSQSDANAPYNSNGSGTLEMAGDPNCAGRFGSVLKVDGLELLYY